MALSILYCLPVYFFLKIFRASRDWSPDIPERECGIPDDVLLCPPLLHRLDPHLLRCQDKTDTLRESTKLYPLLIPPASSLHLHILKEILLSIIHLGLYCVASYMLMTAVTSHLYRLTEVILFQVTYKALTAVYCMGFAAAAVHLFDLVASVMAFGLWQKK